MPFLNFVVEMINLKYLFVPIAVVKRQIEAKGRFYTYGSLYIFGVRIAYWTIVPKNS